MSAAASIEQASGKDRGDENFPVGSWLIRAGLRRHVHAYYAFARNADDIADHPDLEPAEKIARLDAMEAVLDGDDPARSPSAARLRESLAATKVDSVHARELLVAFRQDATKTRYASWDELMQYCRYSAAPVGRYVLDLHGEGRQSWPASDALCASLQVLNHLQDCAKDFNALDRSYIPGDWLRAVGLGPDAVTAAATPPALRSVFDAMLQRTAELNAKAAHLPGFVMARGLRIETAIIVGLARRLHRRLSNEDPLAGRVKLLRRDAAGAVLAGLARLV
ncbi:MAG TPA: squalene synthase HpnC, partial [Acidiphilium sp.]|nr:squalene synthase HpnC [Acidiphilium sp.]